MNHEGLYRTNFATQLKVISVSLCRLYYEKLHRSIGVRLIRVIKRFMDRYSLLWLQMHDGLCGKNDPR